MSTIINNLMINFRIYFSTIGIWSNASLLCFINSPSHIFYRANTNVLDHLNLTHAIIFPCLTLLQAAQPNKKKKR